MQLEDDAILTVVNSEEILVPGKTCEIVELKEALYERIRILPREWIEDGVNCKCLLPKHGTWLKGKVKLAVEFIEDSVEENTTEEESFSEKAEMVLETETTPAI